MRGESSTCNTVVFGRVYLSPGGSFPLMPLNMLSTCRCVNPLTCSRAALVARLGIGLVLLKCSPHR